MKIFINPGHGEHDPGATNKTFNLEERKIAYQIGYALQVLLEKSHAEVKLYQEKQGLNEIAREANAWCADFFVSIHLNSATNTTAKGVETFYAQGSTKGKALAEAVQAELVKPYPDYTFANRGAKVPEKTLAVLRDTKMPAILAEVGFISNDGEINYILVHIQDIAKRLHDGILNYAALQGLIKNKTFEIIANGTLYDLKVNGVLKYPGNKLETILEWIKKNG